MSVPPGTKFGPYEILSPLGAGGMGEVYRARDTRLDRTVAIKLLPSAVAADRDRLARFEREAKVLASLNHPNIAQIYGLEHAADTRALVMELVPGTTLPTPQPLDTALQYARQIADALDAAHEKGITHRDLKPANVMVTPDGVIKVLDFGLATAAPNEIPADPSNSPTLTLAATQAGLIMGTAAYMSPEQAAGNPVDRRSDIWSFGVVLFELLTGNKLFAAESVSHTLADVLRAPIPFDQLNAPQPIRVLIERCLDRNLKTRLQSIAEARIAIDRYLSNPVEPAAPTTTTRRSLWPWAAAAVLAPAAWYLKPQPDPPVYQFDLLPPQGVTMGPGDWGEVQVSPDGSHIVFIAKDRDSRQKLFLRNLSEGASIALPGTDSARAPYWSPDSRQIAFLAEGHIRRFDLKSNQVADVCTAPTGFYLMWHGDGNIYLSTEEHVLQKVRATGGALSPVFSTSQLSASPATIAGQSDFLLELLDGPRQVVQVSPSGAVTHDLLPFGDTAGSPASFAPNPSGGGWLLFSNSATRTLSVLAYDPRSGRLSGDPINIASGLPLGPSWSASNNGVLAYRRARDWGTNRQLTWVDRSGNRGASVGGEGNVYTPRLSPNQKLLTFTRNEATGQKVYVHDFDRATTTPLAVESAMNGFSVWMPDSQNVVYRVRGLGLARHGILGAGSEILFHKTTKELRPTAVSPDGKWVIAIELRVSVPRLVFTAIDSGKQITLGDDPTHHGSLSPDGRWLLYSGSVNGRWDVYVRPAPPEMLGRTGAATGDGRLRISPNGGTQPMWRADGKEIFYVAPGGMLTAVPVQITEAAVRPGAPEPLFQTNLAMQANFQREYDASPDGKRFLLPIPVDGTHAELPITVILNWPKLLKKNRDGGD